MDGLLSTGPTPSSFFLYRMAFLICFCSLWCLFIIPFFTAGYGDDAKHEVARAGCEERGGGGHQPLLPAPGEGDRQHLHEGREGGDAEGHLCLPSTARVLQQEAQRLEKCHDHG